MPKLNEHFNCYAFGILSTNSIYKNRDLCTNLFLLVHDDSISNKLSVLTLGPSLEHRHIHIMQLSII